MRVSAFYKKTEYELPIFFLLFLRLVFTVSFNLFSIKTLFSIVFFAFFAFILGKMLREADASLNRILLVFIAMFLGSAVTNFGLFLNGVYGLPTPKVYYTNLLSVLCVILSVIRANKAGEKWFIPAACFFCTALSPAFAAAYFPVILIVLILTTFEKTTGENIFLCIISIAVTAAGVFVFGRDSVFAEKLSLPSLWEANWLKLAYTFAVTAPLFMIFFYLWGRTFVKSKKQKAGLVFFLTAVLPLFSLLLLVFEKPYYDPVISYLFAQFTLFVYHLHNNNSNFIAALKGLAVSFEKNPLPLLLALIYVTALSLVRYNQNLSTRIFV